MPAAPAWRDRAACADVDPELFFPLPEDPARRAKAICGGCAVREPCLTFAVEHRETYGVWGGLLPEERTEPIRAARKQRRAA